MGLGFDSIRGDIELFCVETLNFPSEPEERNGTRRSQKTHLRELLYD